MPVGKPGGRPVGGLPWPGLVGPCPPPPPPDDPPDGNLLLPAVPMAKMYQFMR